MPAPARGGPDRRRRGGGAARQRGQGAAGKRPGRRGHRHCGGGPARGPHLSADDGQRLRHRAPAAAHGVSAPCHQQAAHRRGPGRHRHPGLPGGGPGGHLRRVPGGYPDPPDRGPDRGFPASGGGRAGPGGGDRVPGGHHHLRAGPVLQHPRPDEIHEKGQRRGSRRGGHRPAPGPEPSGGVLQAAAGRGRGAPHPRRRAAAVCRIRGHGPGLRHGPAGGPGLRRRRAGVGLCDPAPERPRHPGPPAVLRQRPVREKPAAVRRPGGGVPQPPAEGEVPRLRAASDPAGGPGGRERASGQDRGEIRIRQNRL